MAPLHQPIPTFPSQKESRDKLGSAWPKSEETGIDCRSGADVMLERPRKQGRARSRSIERLRNPS